MVEVLSVMLCEQSVCFNIASIMCSPWRTILLIYILGFHQELTSCAWSQPQSKLLQTTLTCGRHPELITLSCRPLGLGSISRLLRNLNSSGADYYRNLRVHIAC